MAKLPTSDQPVRQPNQNATDETLAEYQRGLISPKAPPPAPEVYFASDRGAILLVSTGPDTTDVTRRIVRVSFFNKTEYQLYLISEKQLVQTFNLLVDYIYTYKYLPHLMNFLLEFGNSRKTRDDVREEISRSFGVGPKPPAKAPAYWPGAKKANLVEFLQTHYAESLNKTLTMAHIKKLDEPLYWSIHYAKKTQQFPDDIQLPSRSQLLNVTLTKFFKEGQAALSPKEKAAVVRKAKRPNRTRANSLG